MSLVTMQVSASAWMSLVMSAFLGFLALTVVLATFYVMRSWSVWLGRTRGRRLPAELGGGGAGYGGVGQVGLRVFVCGCFMPRALCMWWRFRQPARSLLAPRTQFELA
jgi:hypothetical protein